MANSDLKIRIVGGSPDDLGVGSYLSSLPGVVVVGWADAPDPVAACRFADHAELLRKAVPEAVVILSSHPSHYRPAIDSLQAGCHVYLDRPFAAGVQEAVDIAGLARAHGLKVGIGGNLRLLPSLIAARDAVVRGVVGPIRMVVGFASGPADAVVAMADALLWVTGRTALEAVAIESGSGMKAISARFAGDISVTLALSFDPKASLSFDIDFLGEAGRLRASRAGLVADRGASLGPPVDHVRPVEGGHFLGNFVEAITSGTDPACSSDSAIDAARLVEAISRSIATGQFVRLT